MMGDKREWKRREREGKRERKQGIKEIIDKVEEFRNRKHLMGIITRLKKVGKIEIENKIIRLRIIKLLNDDEKEIRKKKEKKNLP